MHGHQDKRKRKIKVSVERLDTRTVPVAFSPFLGGGGTVLPFAAQAPTPDNAINQPPLFQAPGNAHAVFLLPGGNNGVMARGGFGPINTISAPSPLGTGTPSLIPGVNASTGINQPTPSPLPAPGGAHSVFLLPGGDGGVIARGGSSLFSNQANGSSSTANGAASQNPFSNQTNGITNQNPFSNRALTSFSQATGAVNRSAMFGGGPLARTFANRGGRSAVVHRVTHGFGRQRLAALAPASNLAIARPFRFPSTAAAFSRFF